MVKLLYIGIHPCHFKVRLIFTGTIMIFFLPHSSCFLVNYCYTCKVCFKVRYTTYSKYKVLHLFHQSECLGTRISSRTRECVSQHLGISTSSHLFLYYLLHKVGSGISSYIVILVSGTSGTSLITCLLG